MEIVTAWQLAVLKRSAIKSAFMQTTFINPLNFEMRTERRSVTCSNEIFHERDRKTESCQFAKRLRVTDSRSDNRRGARKLIMAPVPDCAPVQVKKTFAPLPLCAFALKIFFSNHAR